MRQKISDEFVKLENQFIDMQRTLEKIKEKISYEHQATIDFNHIEKEARNNSLANHPISKNDKELVYRYCLALALIAEISEDNETRIKQYYYIFRVYHASYNDFVCEELLRDAKLVSLDDLNFIKENYSLEQLEYFFVDLLLLFIIGNKQDKQMDLFCELAAFLGITAKQLNLICSITKAILKKDEDALLEIAKEKDINVYYSYFGYVPKYYVVSKISKINSVSSDCVLVFGDKIQDVNEIMNLDDYNKKEIYFKKCCFDNILGIKSKKTGVHFIDCKFENCKFENCKQRKFTKNSFRVASLRYENYNPTSHFMKCNNAQIINTVFESCTLLGTGQNSSVFKFKNSTITECKFINCSIGVSVRSSSNVSVIHAVDTSIVNCEITNCNAYGEGTYDNMIIMSIQQGRITDTKFINCNSDSQHVYDKDDYILMFNDRCKEINNEFINCKAEQTTNHGANRYHEVKIQRN